MTPQRCLVSWSGGKDCCVALYALQKAGVVKVAGLVSTITETTGRMAIHGVRRVLLEQQAAALGLPLTLVELPPLASNAAYEAALERALVPHRAAGVNAVAFGDLFLEDIRAYRDGFYTRQGLETLYPVWGRPTRAFAADFVAEGFKAVVCAVDLERLDAAWLGRPVDAAFLAELPDGIDPCGENGEFHTFVHDGPNFGRPVGFTLGEVVAEGRFVYRELIPTE